MKLGRKKIALVLLVIVSCAIVAWYFYSMNSSYEMKLVKGEEYTMFIGFQQYRFLLIGLSHWQSGEQFVQLTVTSGNNTATREIGRPSSAVGNTYKFLDLEVNIKEKLVDGLRIVVRKW
jgi:hypothetical protein